MDWIRMGVRLGTAPTVVGIANRTGLTRQAVVGGLHAVWAWADGLSPDGRIAGPVELLVGLVDELGGLAGFAAALEAVGLLKLSEGGVELPDWADRTTDSARRRELARLRMQRSRARSVARNGADHAQRGQGTAEPATGEPGGLEGGDGPETPSAARGNGSTRNSDRVLLRATERNETKKRREQNKPLALPPHTTELLQALETYWGPSVTTEQSRRLRSAARQLAAMGASAAELHARRSAYAERWPNIVCTPEALIRHWTAFAPTQAAKPEPVPLPADPLAAWAEQARRNSSEKPNGSPMTDEQVWTAWARWAARVSPADLRRTVRDLRRAYNGGGWPTWADPWLAQGVA